MNINQTFTVKVETRRTDGCGNTNEPKTPGDIRRAVEGLAEVTSVWVEEDTRTSEGEKAVKAIERSVNCTGNGEDATVVVWGMLNMHRTLNQALTGNIILPFIRRMASNYEKLNYDARNEAACKMCKVMWDAVKEKYNLTDGDNCALPFI